MGLTVRSTLPGLALGTLLVLSGCAELGGAGGLQEVLRSASALGVGPLDDDTIVAGLREALEVGTRNTVDSTSSLNGFLANELIRIALPDQLEGMGNALRTIGFGAQVDELEVAMNRTAERAAGEATSVFVDGIRQMTFADARQILQGNETAATDYFRRTTSDTLRRRFSPIVHQKMQEVGVVRTYDGLLKTYEAIPLVSKPDMDLYRYVTDEALDGLFTVLAQEEQKIRTDPAARITPLLQRVFGGQ